MTWPSAPVSTTNVDATTDDPELAVVQIKDSFDKLNQIIAHVSTFVQGLLDDVDAAAARTTLGVDLSLLATLASPTFTGDPKAPTPAGGDNDTSIATTAYVQTEIAVKAPLASPTFTGDPKAPTPAFGDSDTSLATSAFVNASRIVKRKTADEGISGSTTLQDDDHLLFAIAASEEWVADFFIAASDNQAGGNTGVKIALNAPSGATIMIQAVVVNAPSTPDPTKNQAVSKTTASIATALDFTTTIFAGSGSSVDYGIRITAWVLNSTNAGNVTLQWTCSAATGSTLTFRKGSHMVAHRVA